MVGKAMAHNPADVFHVLKTGELQQGCSLLVAPRVQTKTMRVQSNQKKNIPGRQSDLSLSQFIDQPKRCCNIKNPIMGQHPISPGKKVVSEFTGTTSATNLDGTEFPMVL